MISEIAYLSVAAGDTEAMARAIPAALDVVRDDPGCCGAVAFQSATEPTEFTVIIEWTSVEAHQLFRSSPGMDEYRGHIADYLAGTPAFGYHERLGDRATQQHSSS